MTAAADRVAASTAFIVMSFELREFDTKAAALRQRRDLSNRYPSRRFHLIEFADGDGPRFAVSSFRHRLYRAEADAVAARDASAAARPKRDYRVRRVNVPCAESGTR